MIRDIINTIGNTPLIEIMSSGAAYHTAFQIAKKVENGLIVFITCDRGDRYLSSDLFG